MADEDSMRATAYEQNARQVSSIATLKSESVGNPTNGWDIGKFEATSSSDKFIISG